MAIFLLFALETLVRPFACERTMWLSPIQVIYWADVLHAQCNAGTLHLFMQDNRAVLLREYRKRSQSCDSQTPASKRLCAPCVVPTPP